MDRRVTPAKRVTSLTWGPPPQCKQALTILTARSVISKDRTRSIATAHQNMRTSVQ